MDNMGNDEQYKPVKLHNQIIKQIDEIKNETPFLRTRPQTIGYVVDHFLNCKKRKEGVDKHKASNQPVQSSH